MQAVHYHTIEFGKIRENLENRKIKKLKKSKKKIGKTEKNYNSKRLILKRGNKK